MSFPIKHGGLLHTKAVGTNDGSILFTGSLDREDGFFGEFSPNSTISSPARTKFVALYDEEGNLKWIKDLYDEFNIKYPEVHLHQDGTTKIVNGLSGTERIGDLSVTSIDENDAYIAEINANGSLANAEIIRTTYSTPELIFAPDNSYYSLSGYLDDDDRDIVLRKFNSNHQLEWEKTKYTLGLSSIQHFANDQEAFTQSDNSLTFFGRTSFDHALRTTHPFIGRISSEGDIEWKIELDRQIDALSPSKDGGVIFHQSVQRIQSIGYPDESITKVDSSGEIEWTSFFSREDKDGYFLIEEKRNGNIVVASEFGYELDFEGGLKLTADDGASFIAQLDQFGNFTHAQKIGIEAWGTVTGLTNLPNNDSIINSNKDSGLPDAVFKFDDDLIEITTQEELPIPQDSVDQIKEDNPQTNENSSQQSAYELAKPRKYKRKFIDKITNFNNSADALEIDAESFGIKSSSTFAAGKNKKVVKRKLAKLDIDFLYDQKKGGLYFNENGSDKGFGDGGIIAMLKGAPDLTMDNIEFL